MGLIYLIFLQNFNSQDFCVLYISTSIWVLRTPNFGWNMRFQRFLCLKAKNCKKEEIWCKILEKQLLPIF